MLIQINLPTERKFDFLEYQNILGTDEFVLSITPDDIPNAWGFYRKGKSNTLFVVEEAEGACIFSMDSLASYSDYCIFPYLVDTLSIYLCEKPYEENGKGAFEIFCEDWREETIGEEIAYLKCMLSIGLKYYIELPICEGFIFVNEDVLSQYGVCIHSSTSRIYGFLSYLINHDLLPADDERDDENLDDIYVDVPQHESIGVVHSWQTDGAVTTESYSSQDVELLLNIGQQYNKGKITLGVVLNDIGTIMENGIGIERNLKEAIYWYKEAIKQGDNLYAPTSLGDIYRRGYDNIPPNLTLALEAYRISVDPYSWYRIGQSYEEGWVGETDMQKAMQWYRKAASVGHHLALKRLESEEDN